MIPNDNSPRKSGLRYALPFFLTMGFLSVISFILPLRPSVSYLEKRELKKLPTFSLEALADGSYFNDISLWYSDTFPGREGWLNVSQSIAGYHGYGDFAIEGALPEQIAVVQVPQAVRPEELTVSAASEPTPTAAETAPAAAETAPAETAASEPAEEEEDVPLDVYISASAVIQVGDSAFYAVGFSPASSNRYIAALNQVSKDLPGCRIISAPPLTAISMLDKKLLPQLGSADQGELLDYIHGSLREEIVTVDTMAALEPHKKEYLFFRTDHHWTALAAYYTYAEVCNTLGKKPVLLEDCEVIDQGTFVGSIYGRCKMPQKLKKDIVYAYNPPGNITMMIDSGNGFESPGTMIRDLSDQNENMKYLAFLMSDQPLVHITNEDVPDGTCLIIKDSFGNCFVPYFTQNYHEVYAMDYRKYHSGTVPYFVNTHEIDDIIFAPNMMAIQSTDGAEALAVRCGYFS